MATENWARLGLPNSLAIRVGLHSAPIFTGYDPIRKADGLIGSQVNLAARIEPVVSPGHVFATSTFVSLLDRQPDTRIRFDPLGQRELAKGWGVEELFNVRWEREPVMEALPETFTKTVEFLSRDEVDQQIGTVGQRLENLSNELFVSGNDCKFMESQSPLLRSALQRGCNVRLLAVAPFGAGSVTLPMIDPRFPDSRSFRASIASTQAAFIALQTEFPTSFEVRFLPFAPSSGFFLADAGTPSEIFKGEIYAVKPFVPGNSRPHFIIERSFQWYDFWRSQVENVWALGAPAAHYALTQFEVLVRAGSDNIDSELVEQLVEAGDLEAAVKISRESDSSLKQRQFAVHLLRRGDLPTAHEVALSIKNRAERRSVGVALLHDVHRRGIPLQNEERELIEQIYRSIRNPQRRDLREVAEQLELYLDWPDVEDSP